MPLASISEVALHQQNVLRDLCRLQVIEDAESGDRMRLRVRGHVDDLDRLFGSGILQQGTNGPHHRLGTDVGFSMGWTWRRTKTFTLLDNRDHARALASTRRLRRASRPFRNRSVRASRTPLVRQPARAGFRRSSAPWRRAEPQ